MLMVLGWSIDPLAFIVVVFLFDSLSITPYAIYRWLNLIERPNLFPLAIRGVAGGIVAFFSFWIDNVGNTS